MFTTIKWIVDVLFICFDHSRLWRRCDDKVLEIRYLHIHALISIKNGFRLFFFQVLQSKPLIDIVVPLVAKVRIECKAIIKSQVKEMRTNDVVMWNISSNADVPQIKQIACTGAVIFERKSIPFLLWFSQQRRQIQWSVLFFGYSHARFFLSSFFMFALTNVGTYTIFTILCRHQPFFNSNYVMMKLVKKDPNFLHFGYFS